MQVRKTLFAAALTAGILATTAGSALAFDCNPANKPVGAGSVGTVNVATDVATLDKVNPQGRFAGGFVTLTDGVNTADTFIHAPDGVLPPVRDGGPQHNCDGKGLDSLEVCFGG
jgi:hypothetical protein